MNIRPLRDHIVIRPIELERVSSGGIAIPDSIKPENGHDGPNGKPYFPSHCLTGEVVAVGPGVVTERGVLPMEVSVGDKVQYSMNGVREIPGTDLTMIREADVVGFVDAAAG